MTFAYSLGRDVYDHTPRQVSVASFSELVAVLDTTRSPKKDGARYIAGAFNGNGKRCADGALRAGGLPSISTRSTPTSSLTCVCGSRGSRAAPG